MYHFVRPLLFHLITFSTSITTLQSPDKQLPKHTPDLEPPNKNMYVKAPWNIFHRLIQVLTKDTAGRMM